MYQYIFENRLLVLCIYGCRLVMFSCVTSYQINADTLVVRDTYYEGHKVWSHPVSDIGTCATMCMRLTICASFNFDLSTRDCDLNTDHLENNPHLGKSKRRSVYSRIKDWPKQLDPDCFSRPCKMDEVCIPQQLAKRLKNKPRCLKAKASKTVPKTKTSKKKPTTPKARGRDITKQETSTLHVVAPESTEISSALPTTEKQDFTPLTKPTILMEQSTTPQARDMTKPETTSSTLHVAASESTEISSAVPITDIQDLTPLTKTTTLTEQFATPTPHDMTTQETTSTLHVVASESIEMSSEVPTTEIQDFTPLTKTTTPTSHDMTTQETTSTTLHVVASESAEMKATVPTTLTSLTKTTMTEQSKTTEVPDMTKHETPSSTALPVTAPESTKIKSSIPSTKIQNWTPFTKPTLKTPETKTATLVEQTSTPSDGPDIIKEESTYATVSNDLSTAKSTETETTAVFTTQDSTSLKSTTLEAQVRCELPQDPQHGTVNISEGKATYNCSSCYILRGERIRACLPNGQWEGTEPTCTISNHTVGGKKYFFLPCKKKWNEAQEECKKLEGYLVEIETETENQFLVGILKREFGDRSGDWWIGAVYDLRIEAYVWYNTRMLLKDGFTNWDAGNVYVKPKIIC